MSRALSVFLFSRFFVMMKVPGGSPPEICQPEIPAPAIGKRKDFTMDKKIRMGIVGCGAMTTNSHVYAFPLLTDICTVTAVCDVKRDKAENIANRLGGDVFVTTDYREMVGLVDAVLVVLPHSVHYECGSFFAENNVHVLMEKPLCNTEKEVEDLTKIAEEHHVKLMCAYPVRFWRGISKLKELLDSGEYGRIIQMSIWTEQYTRRFDENNSTYERYKVENLGGGQLFSHGCHYIDLLLWFLGKPVSGTHIGSNIGTEWMEREGTSNVIMNFENGAMAYHFGTWGARGSSHDYSFQVFTDKGFFEYRRDTATLTYKTDIHPNPEQPPVTVWEFRDKTKQTQYEIRHFLECILYDRRPMIDGYDSLQSLKVINRLYEAEDRGEIADLRGLGFRDRD